MIRCSSSSCRFFSGLSERFQLFSQSSSTVISSFAAALLVITCVGRAAEAQYNPCRSYELTVGRTQNALLSAENFYDRMLNALAGVEDQIANNTIRLQTGVQIAQANADLAGRNAGARGAGCGIGFIFGFGGGLRCVISSAASAAAAKARGRAAVAAAQSRLQSYLRIAPNIRARAAQRVVDAQNRVAQRQAEADEANYALEQCRAGVLLTPIPQRPQVPYPGSASNGSTGSTQTDYVVVPSNVTPTPSPMMTPFATISPTVATDGSVTFTIPVR